ncbi:MAG TPA: hypothetical protein PK082_02895, partial [Phycisphaerae bacterium]|nr:hypothetical protein [Phycisphaerae bacterium]
ALVGLAVFEKLSAVVLLAPLLAMLALSPRRLSLKHWLACAAGGLIGGAPLIALNVYTWTCWGKLLSLVHVATAETRACAGFLDYAGQYLALGSGATFRAFILGNASGAMPLLDGALTAGLLAAIGALSAARWRTSPLLRLAGAMALSYGLVGAALYLLPQTTWAHHWVQGMPFQYAAMALAVAGVLGGRAETKRARIVRAALPLAVAALLLARIPGCAMLERSLLHGDASIDWHPSLNAMGRFAARHADDAVFLAADWGVGTQIVCHADGREGVLYEPFWDYRGQADVLDIARGCGRDALYVVWKKPPSPIRTVETDRMLRDTETLPAWRRVETEAQIANLPAVGVRKFVRAEPRAAIKEYDP